MSATRMTFSIRNALPEPDVPSLSEVTLNNLNQQLLPIERITVEKALQDCLQEKAKLDEICNLVSTHRNEYEERISMLQKSLAPFRKLPQEIWARIFCLVMESDDEHRAKPKARRVTSYLTFAQLPGPREDARRWTETVLAQLSLVCRMWRRTVLSTPSLWCNLPSQMVPEECDRGMQLSRINQEKEMAWLAQYNHALQVHLSRAGAISLDMETVILGDEWGMDLPEATEYLELLGKALPRLESLDLGLISDAGLSRFANLPQQFDKLQKLRLSIFYQRHDGVLIPEAPLTIFNHCPLLSHLDLVYHPRCEGDLRHIVSSMTQWIQLPWSNLTTIAISGLFAIDAYRILEASPNLVEASFSIAGTEETVDNLVDNWDQMETVTCSKLRILYVVGGNEALDLALTRIQTPSLEHLDAHIPLARIVHSTFPIAPTCLSNLTHLIVGDYYPGFWGGEQWCSLLSQTPNITSLSIEVCHDLSILLHRMTDTTVDPLLPGLKLMMITTGDFNLTGLSNEDPTAPWGTHLNAFAFARFQAFPSTSPMRNGMEGLRLIFPEGAKDFRNASFYRLNGWLANTPLDCPIFIQLMHVFSPYISVMKSLYTAMIGVPDFSSSVDLIPQARNYLPEAIPDILSRIPRGVEGHHLRELVECEPNFFEVLESIRRYFPEDQGMLGELWRTWNAKQAQYLEELGWVQLVLLKRGRRIPALELTPKRILLKDISPVQAFLMPLLDYPDVRVDPWWSPYSIGNARTSLLSAIPSIGN